jgi:hypothetical protein
MAKKKNNDMLGFVMDNATLNVGVMGSASLVGAMPDNPMKASILKGMEPMSMIPMLHATGGVFGQLQNLNNGVKKKKWK